MVTIILLAIIEIFGFFTIGIAAKLSGYIKEQSINEWSTFAIDFLYPFLIFDSITRNFQREQLYTLWPLPLIGFCFVLAGFGAGMVLRFGLFSQDKDIKKTFVHFCAINNSSYLPIVIIQKIWGGTAVADLFLLNIGSTIGLWTIGIVVLQGGNFVKNIKNLFSSNLITVLVSLTITIAGLSSYIPAVFTNICNKAGIIAVPLILTLTGATLANPKGLRINWHVIYVTIIRLIVIPTLLILIIKALPLSKDVYNVSVIVALMPVAVSSALLVRRYGGANEYASSTALFSTSVALISVPLAIYLLY
jgi:malate permease and related proteins